jgi:hypothetical protein
MVSITTGAAAKRAASDTLSELSSVASAAYAGIDVASIGLTRHERFLRRREPEPTVKKEEPDEATLDERYLPGT